MPIEIIYFLIGILGFILAFQDFKSQNVSIIPLFAFLLGCSYIGLVNKSFCFFPILIFLSVGLIAYLAKKKAVFGSADYVAVLAISFLLSDENWPFFLILCGAFGVLISIVFRSRKFPFLPGILISALFIKLLENFS